MKNKKVLIVVVVMVGVAVFIATLFMFRNGAGRPTKDGIDTVSVQKDGNNLVISRDGSVRFQKDGTTYEDFWEQDKVNTFFSYLEGKYTGDGDLITGGQNYIVINTTSGPKTYRVDNDELIDIVENETSGGGGAGGGSGGVPVITTSPTPRPTSTANGPTPTAPTGGSSECLYWRLSYCVRARTPSPTPVVTPPPVVIREPNCDANTQTGKTVIGNELCLPTPTPTPTQ